MMRAMLAGLALIVTAPAAAQTSELPDWLLGKWCPRASMGQGGPMQLEADAQGVFRPKADADAADEDYAGPGPHCLTWSVSGAGEMSSRQTRGYFGRNDSVELLKLSTVRGRLQLERWAGFDLMHSPVRDGRFWMKARGPSTILFERIGSGSPHRIGYRREGDRLTVEQVWKRGERPYSFPMTRTAD
jgi:hypothetical protein